MHPVTAWRGGGKEKENLRDPLYIRWSNLCQSYSLVIMLVTSSTWVGVSVSAEQLRGYDTEYLSIALEEELNVFDFV